MSDHKTMKRIQLCITLLALGVSPGCRKSSLPKPVPSAQPSSDTQASKPPTAEEKKALLPLGAKEYQGPTGSVSGIVKVTGDEAVTLHAVLEKIPRTDECAPARRMYEKLFREGPGRTLADALVTVTGYKTSDQQMVLPASKDVRVELSGCAFSTRTIAMTPKQRIAVFNVGATSGMPTVVGAPSFATMLALPGGDPVNLIVPGPGRYGLADSGNKFAFVNVFALNYATAQVTSLDGRFKIQNIPVGKAEVTAYLPITGETQSKQVEIHQGENLELSLELNFDRAAFDVNASKSAGEPNAAASSSATVPPASSVSPTAPSAATAPVGSAAGLPSRSAPSTAPPSAEHH